MATNGRRIVVALKGGFPMVDDGGQYTAVQLRVFPGRVSH